MNKKPVRGWLFDLDNALNHEPQEWLQRWPDSWARALRMQRPDVPYKDAYDLVCQNFYAHGHVQQPLVDLYGVDGWQLHDNAAELMDHTEILPCPLTIKRFEDYRNLKLEMILVTHSGPNWVDHMLRHIGLDQVFPVDRRITLRDTQGQLKSKHEAPFHIAAERLGIPVDELALQDDSTRNFIIPHRLGMTTVQVTHGRAQPDQPAHVDFRVDKAYHIFDLMEQGLIKWHKPAAPAQPSSPFMALSL